MECTICPRNCRVDRSVRYGFCGAGPLPRVALSDLHYWEEPCISGINGSGAVFFTGCNMCCAFCQNHKIRDGAIGDICDAKALSDRFLMLQQRNAHNVNLVSPAPFVPVIADAIRIAKKQGLVIPIVYNTNAYEKVETLRKLSGLVDIYLPDFKYITPLLSQRFSGTADYADFALPAIKEMFSQTGVLETNIDGIAVRGLIIRHLVLPACVDETRRVLDCIRDNFPAETHISLMRQYTPTPNLTQPPLNRRITDREYDRAINYAIFCGFENVLIQDESSANLCYTPDFTAQQ